jgi:hypothetical protein
LGVLRVELEAHLADGGLYRLLGGGDPVGPLLLNLLQVFGSVRRVVLLLFIVWSPVRGWESRSR